MKFGKHEVWEDVLDEKLDEEVAPELYKIVEGNAPTIYLDSVEFFKRTYFTSSIVEILEKVIKTLRGDEKNNVILIYSLFGGGKSHTLLSVYHALRNPRALREKEVLKPEKKYQGKVGRVELSCRKHQCEDNHCTWSNKHWTAEHTT